ncbi:hypothetical protein O6H91_22G053700 [Diphasiastrum complanatum]|uniref:Uncharacterized protein n=2 Tax=Diphasiastrum complanatum TaxID=34168 RepID=A0ACC2AFK2_DIPCM|nr:hypothetical protein O6H91_22G052800 [Diphasiastrum complanatum]KAJ7516325.1 hypothetical protein O6H91_22G053700 [Diphasiastrum complanatum]
MASEKKNAVSDVGAWAMNVISSVGIIMANKQVMSDKGYAFRFATTLTALHFAVTSLVGFVSAAAGYIPSKHVPFRDLFWFSLISNTSIVGMNLSLMLNSVGFYQIAKLSMIPVVCVLEWVLHSKTYTREVKTAVVVVVMGVGICTVTDVSVNLKGFLAAVVAIVSTSLQQIFIGSLQKKHNIGSFDLLSKTAPIQAASLLLLGPFVDYFLNGRNLLDYNLTTGAIFFIGLSCTLAVFCNISQYLCIGRFSAVSFQVLGHMKTVCVLMLGWLLFDSRLTVRNMLGMVVAVIGMVIYSWAVEVAKASTKLSSTTHIVKDDNFNDEDVSLLKNDIGLQNKTRDIELGK